MKATYLYGAGDVRVVDVPDPIVKEPTDAVVRVVRACVCGSDLHPYHSMPAATDGRSMGHEFVGVVEAVRVPLADGTLVAVPVEESSPLIPALLTLSDVYGTGYHAAIKAGVTARTTRHGDRRRRRRHARCAGGGRPAYDQAIGVVRAGGVISRVGVPQYDDAPVGFPSLFGPNITLTGGPAPARAYIETLLPDVLSGKVDPGKVFDQEVALDKVAEGYQAMNDRTALRGAGQAVDPRIPIGLSLSSGRFGVSTRRPAHPRPSLAHPGRRAPRRLSTAGTAACSRRWSGPAR
ncbi:hypothetical protein GCM10027269_03990 [Kribbella endophytica]